MNRVTTEPILVFGEVLFDCFDDGRSVLGGAPFNVAWNLRALGHAPRLISRVGRDPLGDRIEAAMADWGMERSGLQRDATHPTGQVHVRVRDGEPSFDIAPGAAYDFISARRAEPRPPAVLLYHGSLALRTAVPRQALEQLRRSGDLPLFMDVNLRAPWWRADEVVGWLRRARWVKLNEDELRQLVPDEPDTAGRAERLMAGSAVEHLIVTRGERGVWYRDRRGRVLRPDPVPAPQVVDTVGAGDAFSSVVIAGQARGWPWPLILDRAQAFASAIVGLRGATTTDTDFYNAIVQDWEPA
jgi:fructokinase